jgi:hypothetical protein
LNIFSSTSGSNSSTTVSTPYSLQANTGSTTQSVELELKVNGSFASFLYWDRNSPNFTFTIS